MLDKQRYLTTVHREQVEQTTYRRMDGQADNVIPIQLIQPACRWNTYHVDGQWTLPVMYYGNYSRSGLFHFLHMKQDLLPHLQSCLSWPLRTVSWTLPSHTHSEIHQMLYSLFKVCNNKLYYSSFVKVNSEVPKIGFYIVNVYPFIFQRKKHTKTGLSYILLG